MTLLVFSPQSLASEFFFILCSMQLTVVISGEDCYGWEVHWLIRFILSVLKVSLPTCSVQWCFFCFQMLMMLPNYLCGTTKCWRQARPFWFHWSDVGTFHKRWLWSWKPMLGSKLWDIFPRPRDPGTIIAFAEHSESVVSVITSLQCTAIACANIYFSDANKSVE